MNDFLGERWGSLAREQTQKTKELTPSAEAYEVLKDKVENLPSSIPQKRREFIKDSFSDLQESIQRYISSINDFSKGRLEEIDKEDMARLDEARRLAHNGLMTNLDIIERLFKQEGLDILWRSSVGYERSDVQRWAQEVSNHISNK